MGIAYYDKHIKHDANTPTDRRLGGAGLKGGELWDGKKRKRETKRKKRAGEDREDGRGQC